MGELGLSFTNPVETGEVLDMCLCFGCGGVGCVGLEWVGRAYCRILKCLRTTSLHALTRA